MAKEDVTIRRAPKLWSFMITGALVGIVVAAVITGSAPIDPTVGFWPTFGFFALFGVGIGLVLGGFVGVIVDSRTKSSRGVATVTTTKNKSRKN